MNFFKLYIICITLFLLSACGNNQPPLMPLQPNDVILAVGDSLTYGVGATPDASYPSVLARLTSHKVINAGVSGEESSETLQRINKLLDETSPKLVILCIGGNDIIRKRPYAVIKDNIKKIVLITRQHHAQVILLAVPKLGLSLTAPDFYQELGDDLKVVVDTTTLPELLSQSEYKSDYIHLNAKGYQALAEKVADIIKSSK